MEAFLTMILKVLLQFLWDKGLAEVKAQAEEAAAKKSDEEIRQAAVKKLRERLGPLMPVEATIPIERDKEAEGAFDDFFNSIDHH